MEKKLFSKKGSLILLQLMLLFQQTIQNEIVLKIDETKGLSIINYRYRSYISEVIVNGISGSINNYTYILNDDDINQVTIKFNEYLENCDYMFYHFSNIIYVDFSNFVSSNVKTMEKMFQYCGSLQSINFDNFNTSSVTNMYYMFYGCVELISLNLNYFDTSNVTNMGYMFHYCLKLESLNISKFNTSSVTNMEYMFSYCESLSSINIINFDTSLVTNMEYMFQFCYLIKSLNLNNFNTRSVKSLQGMFNLCTKLQYMSLNNFNTTSVTDMSYMFSYCILLESVQLDNLNTESVTDMSFMFNGCGNLKKLNLDNFNTSSVLNLNNMFYNCNSLISLNLTNFNFNSSTFISMFEGVNTNMKYCIDDTREYKFLDILMKKYEKNCQFVCIADESRSYIPEKGLCVDNCSMSDEYKYDYNNICYEKCPTNTLLINNTYYCKAIVDEKDGENEEQDDSSQIIMISSIVGGVILIGIIIILIYRWVRKSKKYKKLKQENKDKSVELLQLHKNSDYLNKKLERYPVSLEKGEYLMTVIFTTTDQKFNYSVICKNTSIVKDIIKKKLYKEYPDYSMKENYFLCNGNSINIYESFQENKIKDGDIIVMGNNED